MKLKQNLSSHVVIVSMGANDEGEHFLELIISTGGRRRRELLSLHDLQASPHEALARLDARLMTQQARNEFLDRVQLQCVGLQPSFHVVSRPGWHDAAFVFPDGSFLPPDANLRVALPFDWKAYGAKFRSRGALKRWKRIAELARGNSRLMLAISLAFVGPVVDLLKVENVMIQLFGPPGAGKTAIAAAAGSVWGGDADGLFAESWNHTGNNIERVAAAHHASFLVLDETRTSDQPQSQQQLRFGAISSTIMRLAEGKMKGRLTDVPSPHRSRPAVLSTSNFSLDAMSQQMPPLSRVEVDDALRGRMTDVPLLVGVLGAFEDLHGCVDHQAMSSELLGIAREDSGIASEEYIDGVIEWLSCDRDGLIAWLKQRREAYRAVARRRATSSSRDLARIHEKFATIFAAADLARRMGILPWTSEEIGQSLIACEQAHVAYVAGIVPSSGTSVLPAPVRPTDPLEGLRAHVRAKRASFPDLRTGLLDPNGEHDHAACDGYLNEHRGVTEYLFPDAKLMAICGGKAALLRLKDDLRRKGWLVADGNRPSTRRTIWATGSNKREQVIAVRADAFDSDG